ncbi:MULTISPECIES: YycH family regulatory protein [Bacillus cereus group]|uniref:Regulatory protein YycH domain-containing protein n=1 Tax=Bacillus cereus TaxID=1396 RepID=A0A9X7CI51_BACCE|nr:MULTISPECIES: two-component system activity regulator YycH [Bacillus cereus group]MCC2507344.1 two-component system activity regulator YycH [Bacillus cereus]MDA2212960.1 two-component system activity regulator YycH [Bacillus cereus]MDA2223751.1 two-component system activity regulator YycH [Bacillus cereus]MDA2251651.1 two-component system activity regulator YycH [Bacillus cereus]MDA2279607.1 two-component system activity regulator YycH [Bacillus cereus]
MSMENFKTIVLINLVVISLFLTFNLWTYVPDSTSMQNAKFVQGNEGMNQTKISDVVRPTSIIVHKDKNHYGSKREADIESIYKPLEVGELHGFREISITKGDFLSYVHGEGKVELVFPTDIPFDAVKSMFNMKEKSTDKPKHFNRILLDPSRSKDQEIKINFVSDGDNFKIYEAKLSGLYLKDIVNAQNQFIVSAKPYFDYQLNDMKKLFLPDGTTELSNITYISSNLAVDTFKNALFSDPRYLSPITEMSKETFTDGIRSMEIENDRHMLKYKNSSVLTEKTIDNLMLLQKSFEFVSGHSGSLDSYRLDYMNKGETVFRLNEDGYPVFNANGLAELRQVWGSEEVMEYERPLLSLNTKGIEQKVTLPSGHVVIASLENNPEIKKQVIKDIGIGYKLSLDGQVVRLQPIWYVKLVEDETGKQKIYEWSEGGLNGLGSD